MTQTHAATLHLQNLVLAKLEAEGLTIDSPWDKIEACLSQVVAPSICIKAAIALRSERTPI